MSNTGRQFGTDVERKVVTENPNLFRSGMMFAKVGDKVKYSYGDPRK
jgi:hypothetical protein